LDKDHYAKLIKKELAGLPDYVTEFYINKNLAITTSYQYLTEIRRFFDWLRQENISSAKTNKDVQLKTLEHLKRTDVMLFLSSLRTDTNRQDSNNSPSTVNRTINALRSLYHYLTVIADSQDGEPYFYRNVMQKIPLQNDSETLNYRAHQLESRMYTGQIKHDFIDFLENQYEGQCSKQQQRFFTKNKERDIALVAFLLGTGVRVSEAANTNVDDLHLKNKMVDVTRKGGQHDSVPMAPWSVKYVDAYLKVRNSRYSPEKGEKALFLTDWRKQGHRITTDAIERLVSKYSTAFGRPLTPHKLRHTLASELYEITKDEVLVSQQLGQRGTSATALYTHVNQTQQRDALNKIE